MAHHPNLRDISGDAPLRSTFLSGHHRQFVAVVLELHYVVRA
jgi:hypothetical protein